MITKRIIPCLDVRDGKVTKGVRFLENKDIADPVEMADFYSRCGADELVFYDITASSDGRALFADILCETAKNVFIPLTVGGGIGQSRLCMALLAKVHVGEVQCSVWPEDMVKACADAGIALL